jgi:hypothetical protein
MNCKDAQFRIDESFMAGQEDLAAEIRKHVDTCRICAGYLAELAELQTLLAGSGPDVHPGELEDLTFEKIVAVADSKGRGKVARSRRFEHRWLWAPMAAAAIIVLTVLIPKFTGDSPSGVALNTSSDITSTELINDIAESDSLGDVVLAEMADDINVDYIAEALIDDSDINDLLHGLTQGEMEALFDKIDDLPETGQTGKG